MILPPDPDIVSKLFFSEEENHTRSNPSTPLGVQLRGMGGGNFKSTGHRAIARKF